MFRIVAISLYYIKQMGRLHEAIQGIEMGTPIDIVQIDMTRTWEILGEVIGESVHESLIDQLFSQFCLGK